MKKKKIAIFGNTGNLPLSLAMGLRQTGHDVRLILYEKELLHRPESVYPKWVKNYPAWIIDCTDLTLNDFVYKTAELNSCLFHLCNDVDLAILNGVGPSLSEYLNCPHISLLTGADLMFYGDFKTLDLLTSTWDANYKNSLGGRRFLKYFSELVVRQRDGIASSKIICFPYKGLIPSADILLASMGAIDNQRFMLYIGNNIGINPEKKPKNKELNLFCGCRIVFSSENRPRLNEQDSKHVDKLIKGFAEYVRDGGKGLLKLVEKGDDIHLAKKLVKSLDIENHITWLQEMSVNSFHKEIIAADLVCDQLGDAFQE